ncbi:MAG: T9SS type A sorting domain-containing protein [Bacteroidetes bacterium]|nr:T9SS type A sorting domain-containing protein [Bacteroidota bacterium]
MAMKINYLFIFLLQVLLIQTGYSQNSGSLDTTFNIVGTFTHDFGFIDNITDVKIQPADQKIVVAGTALTPSFSGKLLVARLLPEGGFDTTFNDSGSVIIPFFNESYAYETFIKNDGKIVVAGAAADPSFQFTALVLRLNEDGSIDSTFGTNGFSLPEISTGDDFAYAMAEQIDHKIVIAGTAVDANFRNAPCVMRMEEDGAIDSTFGTNGVAYIPISETDNELTSVVIQPDGKILVSGHIDNGLTSGGQFDFDVLVARFNTDGTADITFGNNGVVITAVSTNYIDDAFGMQLTSNGGIIVVGFTTQPNFSYDAIVLQYDSTGSLDTTFGTNGITIFDNADQDIAFDVEVQSDGKILIAGNSGEFIPNPNDFMLARYNSNGTLDNSFGTNGFSLTPILADYDEAESMAIQADGKIVLGGKAYNGSQFDMTVARFNNDVSSSINELIVTKKIELYPNPVSKSQPLTIVIESDIVGTATVEIFDLPGSLAAVSNSMPIQSGTNHLQITLPATLVPGLYFLKTSGNFQATYKLVVTE